MYVCKCVGTLWIYLRDTFMGLSYLYGKKFVAPPTPLILQLREELYPEPYAKINWTQTRNRCGKVSSILENKDVFRFYVF